MDLDNAIAAAIQNLCKTECNEENHRKADEILLTLLAGLGYTKTVEAWSEVDKWYA